MEWSTHEVVQVTGTTSRTLRHYDQVGLLTPSRTGAGGYRYYDEAALLRLQRILLLRELELGLPAIGQLLSGDQDPATALRDHLTQLRQERGRIDRVMASVQETIDTLEGGGRLVAEKIFDGFDHSQYKDEVERRWGKAAYADSNRWWRSATDDEKKAFTDELQHLIRDFAAASAQGLDVHSEEVQAIARRQFDWVRTSWGGREPSAEAFTGLGQLYVDDPRFAANYTDGGREYAAYVRDAMAAYAEANLA